MLNTPNLAQKLPKVLKDIAKPSAFHSLSSTKIKTIWNQYHSVHPKTVSTVIPVHEYQTYTSKLEESPLFLFPLFREEGHFFLLSQNYEREATFTLSESYKEDLDEAEPQLQLTFFEELMGTKSIVLVRGDINSNLISKTESELVMNAFLDLYTDEHLYKTYTLPFNKQKDKFDHEGFLKVYLEDLIKRPPKN